MRAPNPISPSGVEVECERMLGLLSNGWVEDVGTGILFAVPGAIAFWKKLEAHHREVLSRHDALHRAVTGRYPESPV